MRLTILGICGPSALIVLAASSCTTDYQMGREDPKFGAPNALAGQKQPGPSSANTITDGGGAGGGATTPECVKSGGTILPDGGACAVSFKGDLLTAFTAANCSLASCHGGTSPQNQPRIDPADGNIWAEFAAFKLSTGVPYINPCSTDLAKAAIHCNVNKTTPCGALMPPGAGLAADVVKKFETWVQCGSPNN